MAERNSRQGRKLSTYRKGLGLSVRAAAEQLSVSHPALRAWESGKSPSGPFREAIERWSGGEIAADEWPLTAQERAATTRLRGVSAAEPSTA